MFFQAFIKEGVESTAKNGSGSYSANNGNGGHIREAIVASHNGQNGDATSGSGARNGHIEGDNLNRNGSHDDRTARLKFSNAFGACNFIVTWDGEDVRELLAAIRVARESTDRFIQDKLIEYILNIPYRNPRPPDIPAFVGKPVWAVDKHGRAVIGMPGSEVVVDVSTLRGMLGKDGPTVQLKPDA